MPQPWETAGKQPWETAAGTQVKQAPPAYPYEGPQAAATLQRTQQEIKQAEATAGATTREKTAQATKAEIDAKQAQEQWNISHPNPNGTEAMSGPAYMQQLQKTDPGRAAYIQGLAEGRVPFPGAQMMRSPAGIALLNQVMRADPTIDATNYQTRAAGRKNAAVGNLGASDNALITAVGHAARLHTLVPEVFGDKFTPFNDVANWADRKFFGGDQPTYNQNARLLGDEVASAYKAGTGGERDENAGDFSSSLATGQKEKNILGAIDLMSSKLAANRAQFAYGNGQLGKPDFMLLPPQTREQLLSIPGSRDVVAKYFAGIPVMGQNGGGNQPPPSSGNSPSGSPDYSPMAPSGMSGFSSSAVSPRASSKTVYDNQTSGLVNGYLRQGLSYHAAVAQLGKDAPGAQLNSSPSQWNEAVQWRQAHKNANVNQADATKTVQMSLTDRLTNGFAQSGTGAFLGNYENAMAFGLPKLAAGQDQSALFNSVADQNNPAQAFTGDLAGTLGGLSLAGKGVSAAARGLEGSSIPALQGYGNIVGGSAPRAALTGDTIYGGVSGAAQNPDHPVLGAAGNMTALAAGHGAGKYILGPGAAALGDTKLGQFAVNKARSLGGLVTGGTPAPFMPPQAPELNLGGATQQALPDITSKLQQAQGAGLPYMVADADPRLRAMLGSATRFSPDVRAQAENTLVPRQLGQGERAIGQINTNLAPVGDVPTLQADILKSAQTKSAPLYTAAKAQPVPDLTKNPALAEVFDRPAGQSAIRKGYETALNKGEDVGTLTYATDASGNQVASGNPSWNVIHYARQALDANGDTDVRHALDKQIAGLNPGFKAADAAYSGTMKGSDALQAGSDATAIKVTPETTLASLNNAGPNTPLFQQGYASNLADMIGRQRMAGNPYDLVNGSMFQKQKMGSVFPHGADAFNTAHSLENDMGKTYQSVIGGSPTQPRAMDDKLFTMGDMADGGMDLGAAALTGTNPIAGLISLGVRKGIDAAKFGMGKTKADAIAPFLMNQDPAASLATLSAWAQQNAARKAYLDQVRAGAGQLGAGFSAPAIYGASQN